MYKGVTKTAQISPGPSTTQFQPCLNLASITAAIFSLRLKCLYNKCITLTLVHTICFLNNKGKKQTIKVLHVLSLVNFEQAASAQTLLMKLHQAKSK